MLNQSLEKHLGEIAVTLFRIATWPPGHQVIFLKEVESGSDPLLEVESAGQLGWLHLSEIEFTGKFFEV